MTSVTVNVTANDGSTGSAVIPLVKPLPPMLVGANAADFTAAQVTLGHLNARRVFYKAGLPAGYNVAGIPADSVGFISYKQDTANTTPFVRSCPPGTRIIYHHEPENEYNGNGAAFVAEFNTQYEKCKAANPLIKFGMVGMAYQYYGGRFGVNGSFIPDKADFYGVDVYTPKPDGNGLTTNPGWVGWLTHVRNRGIPLSVTEYGVGVHAVNGTDTWSTERTMTFINDLPYLKTIGVDSVLYWYNTGAAGDWRFTDKPSVLAWQAFSR